MARPIAETPTIYGNDTKRFMENMRKIDNLTKEQKRLNREEFEQKYKEIEKKYNLRFQL